MDKPGTQIVLNEKPATKANILYDSIYEMSRVSKSLETQSRA